MQCFMLYDLCIYLLQYGNYPAITNIFLPVLISYHYYLANIFEWVQVLVSL